jgi:hypothetical protein
MPRPCTVCRHPDRAGIEVALTGGTPYRDIARQHHVSKDAVRRHRLDHVDTVPASPRLTKGPSIPTLPRKGGNGPHESSQAFNQAAVVEVAKRMAVPLALDNLEAVGRAITPEKFEKANARDLAVCFGIFSDKARAWLGLDKADPSLVTVSVPHSIQVAIQLALKLALRPSEENDPPGLTEGPPHA